MLAALLALHESYAPERSALLLETRDDEKNERDDEADRHSIAIKRGAPRPPAAT